MTSSNKLNLTHMKTMFVVVILAVPVLCCIGLMIYRQVDVDFTPHKLKFGTTNESTFRQQRTPSNISNYTIHIAVVMCGSRLEDGFVMLKSAVIFSQSNLVLHVFTEEELKQAVKEKFESWPYNQKSRLKLVIHNIEFPPTPDCQNCTPEVWKSLFGPCAAQRLFIPELLTDVDSVIYLDADAIFLSPVEEAWKQFANFGPRHSFGIAPILEPWYSKHLVPHCYSGLNSGALFMNLTRIRESNWLASIHEYFQKYRKILQLGDQDLINIYCFFNPGSVYMMECVWNYRGRFCEDDMRCDDVLTTTGIKILHAYAGMHHNVNKWPHIVQVYKAFREYNLTKHNPRDLYNNIVNRMKSFSKTKCGERLHVFTRHLQKYITRNNV